MSVLLALLYAASMYTRIFHPHSTICLVIVSQHASSHPAGRDTVTSPLVPPLQATPPPSAPLSPQPRCTYPHLPGPEKHQPTREGGVQESEQHIPKKAPALAEPRASRKSNPKETEDFEPVPLQKINGRSEATAFHMLGGPEVCVPAPYSCHGKLNI